MVKRIALLVMDMQNIFVEPGSLLEVKGIRKNLSRFKEFIQKLRCKDVLIIYTRHCYTPKNNPIEAELFPKLKNQLQKKSHGWRIYDQLKPSNSDIVIDKPRYDAFFNTRLDEVLKSKGIDTLIITGTMTNICCESTARSGMYRDYKIIFCSDLTYCSKEEVQKNTLKNIHSHFGKVMSSREILGTI